MNLLQRLINKAAKIETNEIRAVLLSFAFVFSCLASYYIIRPVRDGMSSDWSDAELSTIWTFTFIISFFDKGVRRNSTKPSIKLPDIGASLYSDDAVFSKSVSLILLR